jgi:hypothetical protein
MPTLKVNEIISYSGNTLSLGTSGDTVTVPANVTFNALSGNVYIPNGIIKLDTITVSATTTFNLTYGGSAYSPASANACLVSVNGVIQTPGTAFNISGSQIIFSSALSSTDTINFIIVLAAPYTLNAPGGGTVGFNQITSNLITGATAETSIAGGDSVLIYDDSASALRKMTRTNLFSGVAVNAPAFSVYRNGNQTVSGTTTTKIQFNTEDFDTNSNFDSTTNYRFTPTVAGYYQLNLQLTLDNNGSGAYYEAYIYKNGSVVRKASATGQTLNSIAINLSEIIYLNGTTDYAEGFGMVSGTYLYFVGNTADKTRFSGALIRTG